MYTPPIFKPGNAHARELGQNESAEFSAELALMREFPFATVISFGDGAPMVSHLPLLISQNAEREITLTGHLARANPHGHHFAGSDSGETLCIFHGPHTYITPSWYVDPLNVPTWNYAVVHAYGQPSLVEDEAGIHRILQATVTEFERHEKEPWSFALPADFRHGLIGAIVGFEMRVLRMESKFKLSQNRAPEDRAGVLRGLAERTDEMSRRVLGLMSSGEDAG